MDNNLVKLYQFHPIWKIPNPGPFCLKLETYCKIAEIPYQTISVNDPRKSPKGKLPHLQHGDNTLGDSELIIDYLQKHFPDPDQQLSVQQKATARAITRLCDDHLYWVIMYSRWWDDTYWPEFKEYVFGRIPVYQKWFIERLIRRELRKQVYYHGLGRHTRQEVYHLGQQDIMAISTLLGQQNYFFGEKISSIDATLFGFLANIIYPPLATPIQEYALSLENLLPYCERIFQSYYPEMYSQR